MSSGAARPAADLRVDRLTGATSLVVPAWETSKAADPRPLPLELPAGTSPCPFCPEQMADATHRAGEIVARAAGMPRRRPWALVALINRWPHTLAADASEVVVLSDEHGAHLATLSDADARRAVEFLAERAEVQRAAGRHPLVFVNHGANAGSSQPHPHGQVIGLPSPDPLASAEEASLADGACVLCAGPDERNLVARLDGGFVVVPDAPRVDYDQLVVASAHGREATGALADGVVRAVRALYEVTGPVAYNLVFHLEAHPHVHVTPRTTRHSGYSLVGITPCYVAPERAAERLAVGWAAAEATRGAEVARGVEAAAGFGFERDGSGGDGRRSDAA